MSTVTGTRTTYTDTGTPKRSVADLIHMIDPTEAVLLDLLGIDNVKKFRLSVWPRTKYEWMEDALPAKSGTLNEALDDSETGVDVQTGEGALLKAGDVIKVESELMYVASVSSNTATVTRGFAGTTAANHADDTAWARVTIARREGADFTTGPTTTMDMPYNYTQIISEAVQVTGSAQVDTNYGITDQMAYQLTRLIGGGNGGTRNKAGVLALALQGTFYHGQRAVGAADSSRSMGGFEYFVTTNVTDLAGAALLRNHVEDLQQACFDAGGDPDHIICNSWVKRKITNAFKENVQTTLDTRKGGLQISTISTDLGDLKVVLDRECPADRLYMFEKDKLGWIPYRPFDIVDRASVGDYMVKDVVGEYGFVLMNEAGHGYLKNISTTK